MWESIKAFSKKYNIDVIAWICLLIALVIIGGIRYANYESARREAKALSDSYAIHVIYQEPNGNINDIIATKVEQGTDAVRVWAEDGTILGLPFSNIIVYRDKPADMEAIAKYNQLEEITIRMLDDSTLTMIGVTRCSSGGYTNPDNQILFSPLNQIKTDTREYYVASERLFTKTLTE